MPATAEQIQLSLERIERLRRAVDAQRSFLGTIPDPDTRYRAEGNLLDMVFALDELRDMHTKLLAEE